MQWTFWWKSTHLIFIRFDLLQDCLKLSFDTFYGSSIVIYHINDCCVVSQSICERNKNQILVKVSHCKLSSREATLQHSNYYVIDFEDQCCQEKIITNKYNQCQKIIITKNYHQWHRNQNPQNMIIIQW